MAVRKSEVITQESLGRFFQITGIDLTVYFSVFASFIDKSYPKIIDFYSGQQPSPDRVAFVSLESLINLTNIASQKITFFSESLTKYEFWVIVEKFEDIKQKVDTISNISKYLRSSINSSGYKKDPLIQYTLKQGETLESLSKNQLTESDPWNQWTTIALDNQLREEDYTNEGGNSLSISYKNNSSIFVNSVVDNLNLKNVYGKDFYKKITFNSDLQDLETLNPKDTVIQSAVINAKLRKGNNPAFPEDGVDVSLAVGRNFASISFPSILRQLQTVFSKDDTFSTIEVTLIDINKLSGRVEISFVITTVLGEILPKITVKI